MDALRDDLVRALPALPYRDNTADDGSEYLGVMEGEFARFGEWTEIDSYFEGRFMERIAPGAFSKTFAENRANIKVLYDHGHDPSIGNKVLGPIRDLSETTSGAFYGVPLFDTSYNRDLLPGLRAGVYGASFRFRVVRDEWNDEPERSSHNPDGLPERTIKETRTYEFGPVTFPAYASATAGMRSLTDEYLARRFANDPAALERLAAIAADLRTRPSLDAAPVGTSDDGRAANTPTTAPPERAPGLSPYERRLALVSLSGDNR